MTIAMLPQWLALAGAQLLLVPTVDALTLIPADVSGAKVSRNQEMVSVSPAESRTTGFAHGVGSFDPSQNSIMLWTRYTPPPDKKDEVVEVAWEIEDLHGGSKKNGIARTDADSDFTVSVKVNDLNSYTSYSYYFSVNGDKSAIGRTKTLPAAGDTNAVKVAVVSCALYESGLFNVYKEVAASDVDVVIHLGDYIYEYAPGKYGTTAWMYANNRTHEPATDAVTLDDYRTRHQQYRSDPDSQLVHQSKPFIVIYDDHEAANDARKGGAENHDASTQGPWSVRKAASLKAWHEYFPSATAMGEVNYRSFEFGDILSLFMVDTRLAGRDEQVSLTDYFDTSGNFDAARFMDALQSPGRSILGSTQIGWLHNGLAQSSATWQVLGSAVLMAKYWLPSEVLMLAHQITAAVKIGQDPSTLMGQLNVVLQQLSAIKMQMQAGAEVSAQDRARVMTGPVNLDAWDGYLYEREMVYNAATGKNLISIAGDSHNAWHHKLTSMTGECVGHEFGTPSVSSPGLEGSLGLAAAQALVAPIVLLSDDTQYSDLSNRGYVHLTFTHTDVAAEYIFVSSVLESAYTAVQGYSVTVNATYTTELSPSPAPAPSERCKAICSKRDKPWGTKCTWETCKGCSDCANVRCRSSCAEKTHRWKKKCKWENCVGCSECTAP